MLSFSARNWVLHISISIFLHISFSRADRFPSVHFFCFRELDRNPVNPLNTLLPISDFGGPTLSLVPIRNDHQFAHTQDSWFVKLVVRDREWQLPVSFDIGYGVRKWGRFKIEFPWGFVGALRRGKGDPGVLLERN